MTKRSQQSLSTFIARLAHKIDILYPNNCADKEDYIQEGHLKLAEINGGGYKKLDFMAYAIISIARAMRELALGSMGAASAPARVKRKVHIVELLLSANKTDCEICDELKINTIILKDLKSLIKTESWYGLFNEPTYSSEPFSVIDDILSSRNLTGKDKTFLRAQFYNNASSPKLTRRQRWSRMKDLRPILIRSGYGT